MEASTSLISAHPQGECKTVLQAPAGKWPVDTPGGRLYAEWDEQFPVTREGQLMFFFQFLRVGGRWEEFLRECPLHYTGNRGSGAANVMGTMLGSVACAGLMVLVRLRWQQPVRSGDPTVRRTPVARFLPGRRQGRVLQLDPPARHAPETRR